LAKKKNWENIRLPGGKHDRKSHSHFGEGTGAKRQDGDLQQSHAMGVNPPNEKDDFHVEANEFYSSDEVGIHREPALEFETFF